MQHTIVNEKGQLHKALEMKQLKTCCSRFIFLQFPALTFAPDLGGTTQVHVDFRMYVSTH